MGSLRATFYTPVLASGGVYIAHCRQIAGELLPRLSILTAFAAVSFCCTVLEVAFTGSYPAPLPCDARTFLKYFMAIVAILMLRVEIRAVIHNAAT